METCTLVLKLLSMQCNPLLFRCRWLQKGRVRQLGSKQSVNLTFLSICITPCGLLIERLRLVEPRKDTYHCYLLGFLLCIPNQLTIISEQFLKQNSPPKIVLSYNKHDLTNRLTACHWFNFFCHSFNSLFLQTNPGTNVPFSPYLFILFYFVMVSQLLLVVQYVVKNGFTFKTKQSR